MNTFHRDSAFTRRERIGSLVHFADEDEQQNIRCSFIELFRINDYSSVRHLLFFAFQISLKRFVTSVPQLFTSGLFSVPALEFPASLKVSFSLSVNIKHIPISL